MTGIEELLSRALLVRERTVPRDVVPSPTSTAAGEGHAEASGQDAQPNAATEDLHALCETLVSHTPPATVVKFVTDQVPEPRSALVLACILQLTDDTAEGARFWWQYAAGAGQAAAAYCLYLHHLALGEQETADWWHRQVDIVQPTPEPPAWEEDGSSWNPAENRITSASTSQFMRILRHLAQQTVRSRPASVGKLMAYIPAAVTAGYLREPDSELPLPGGEFARRINALLAAVDRPHTWSRRPSASLHEPPRASSEAESVERPYLQKVPEELGTARH